MQATLKWYLTNMHPLAALVIFKKKKVLISPWFNDCKNAWPVALY